MSEDTQQVDVAAAKRRMDAAVKSAQTATQAREAAEAAEAKAVADAKERIDDYTKAVAAASRAAIGVKPRGNTRRRRTDDTDTGGDGQVHGGAQVYALGAR